MQTKRVGSRETSTTASHDDIRVDLTGVLAEEIGAHHGLAGSDWLEIEPELIRVADEIRGLRPSGRLDALDLGSRVEEIAPVLEIADHCRKFPNFVLLGIGGSALGAKAILDACLPPFAALLPEERRGGPRVFIAENVDPGTLAGVLDLTPPGETIVNVISKSGTTIETLAQFLVAQKWLEESLGEKWREHVVVTTDPSRGFLRRLAVEEGLRSLAIPSAVGGRFSVLTPVGLLPASVAGISVQELLAGAARMDERCRERSWKENPGLALAATHVLMDRVKGKGICVLMPYADPLRSFADWFCQLWAESLGKRRTRTGDERSPVGQTPVRAVGATDQHSQLQLYVEGPNDKLLTLIEVARHSREIPIPRSSLPHLEEEGLGHVGGHGLGELLNLERSATEMVLRGEQRPVLNLELPDVSPYALGQLFYLYEWATIAAGMLYHVDPFDQPGVEEGKRLTHASLGKVGLEALRDRIEAHRLREDRFRI